MNVLTHLPIRKLFIFFCFIESVNTYGLTLKDGAKIRILLTFTYKGELCKNRAAKIFSVKK
jgi:hypothetical protein